MADGPRCKRRKQANPRRNNVTNYNTVVETNSDSDDEDKLHIVEEDSVTDAADCEGGVPEDDLPADQTVLPGSSERDGNAADCWEEEGKEGPEILGPEAQADEAGCTVKDDECDSDAENEQNHDPNVEEFLQQQDTAVIYPEAPEEDQRQGTPEASGHDENGTPDAFSQLLTCPYCDRGYKRFTSLKEHIKYRHEKNEDNFSCSLCSYTFAYRTQLERHMTSHKSGRDQRHVAQSGGNRKFKCTECGKAFKYKHHLKEHLRIHSGEKPYECPNCKKRFSHSGSYSSHISSKKCISLLPVNGRPRTGLKTAQCSSPPLSASPGSPTRPQIRQKLENRPLQEQLSVNQIKTEPVDYEFKPIVVASGINCSTPLQNGVFSGGGPLQAASSPQGVVQAVVLPTVGLVSPISINLSDIQNVLKVAVDGNVIRQVLENNQASLASKEQETISASSIQQGGHSVISAISLPLVDQDGTTKIIINYSLEQPSQLQVVPQNLKKENPVPTNSCKSEKLPEDLTVKSEKDKSFEGGVNDSTCLLCDDCPGDLNALPELKHYDVKQPAQPPPLPAPEAEKSESSVSSGTGDGSLSPSQPPLKNLLSLLKAYYALNAQPSAEELSKIADSVNLPLDVVKKWFEKMQAGQISVQSSEPSSPEPDKVNIPAKNDDQPQSADPEEPPQDSKTTLQSPLKTARSPVPPVGSGRSGSRSSTPPPSPLNLSSARNTQGYPYAAEGAQEEPQVEPLDLSLPKQQGELLERPTITSVYQNSVYSVQEEPLNLSCAKKEPQKDSCVTDSEPVVNVIPPSANPINIAIPTVTAQLPTIVAIADQNSVPCLRALAANKQTILIPQVAYTYSATVSPAVQEAPLKVIQPNGNQDERQDTSSEGVSNVEDQNDSDSTPPKKKMRKTENGMYACDLCDKIFQKSSSLLRHKYEHTGKRPHECGICKKAFKHKHHLIEHMRLHSGEKPYQCDKCGKRFSHSGSYSQHMNHRYSYCKREAEERDSTEQEEAGPEVLTNEHASARASPSQVDSDGRESLTREEDEDSEKEEEEEEDREIEELQEEKECEKPQGDEEEEEEEEDSVDDAEVNEEDVSEEEETAAESAEMQEKVTLSAEAEEENHGDGETPGESQKPPAEFTDAKHEALFSLETNFLEEEGGDDCSLKVSQDPFVHHVNKELKEKEVQALPTNPKTTHRLKWPTLGQLVFSSRFQRMETFKPPKDVDLKSLHLQKPLGSTWTKTNGQFMSGPQKSRCPFSPLQKELFLLMNSYRDLFYPERTALGNGEEIRRVYCLHALNHVLKANARVLSNNTRRRSQKPGLSEDDGFRDQGLTRPKVLMVVPFREAALRLVQLFISLFEGDSKKKVVVSNRKRFQSEYGSDPEERPPNLKRPEDYEAVFVGNIDDHFRIGVAVLQRSIRLYAPFYSSDILIASPLGLRTIIGGEGVKKRDCDFLSSIELLIIDQADIYLMQNWEHVLHLMDHMNLLPLDSHGVDFSRVRMWSLNNWARFYRQTLLFGALQDAQINSVFNRFCVNLEGQVAVRNVPGPGSISHVLAQLPHVFQRMDPENLATAIDARFNFFVNKILPQYRDAIMSHTLIYVPSYFDYVRLRNYFKREELNFTHICEYTQKPAVSRARHFFLQGEKQFLLLTERFHFYKRYTIRGIRNLLFYELPTYPHFYSEICNMLQATSRGEEATWTCTILYSKFDAQRLAAVVGAERAAQMLQSKRSVHLFVTGEQ